MRVLPVQPISPSVRFLSLSPYRRWHLSAAATAAAAGLFCGSRRLAGLLSRHTLTPLLLVSLLHLLPRLPRRLVLSACVLSVAFCPGVITGQSKSHFSGMSCLSALPQPPPPPLLSSTPSVLLLKSCPWRSHVTFCAPRHAVPHRCYP